MNTAAAEVLPAAYLVRPGSTDDHAFVYATWLRGYKRSSAFARRIPNSVFFTRHHQVIERILLRGAQLHVAALSDSPDTIVGYLVVEQLPNYPGGILHWAYTKLAFRGFGVFRSLLVAAKMDPDTCTFTHWSYDVDQLITKWPNATYSPYEI